METDKWKEKGKKEEDKPSFLSKVVRKFSWLANFPFSLFIIKNASRIESCALNHFPLSTEGDLWCSLLPSWHNFNPLFFHCNQYLEEISGIREYIVISIQVYYCPLLSNLIWFSNSLCSATYPTEGFFFFFLAKPDPTESWFHIYVTIDVISFVTM